MIARSALYVPCHRWPTVRDALADAPDVLIIDLEDSVPPENKPAAEQTVGDVVQQARALAPRIAVRVNRHDTPWGSTSLAAALGAQPDLLVLPKASAADVARLVTQIGESLPPLWAMIESPDGVLAIADIVSVSDLVETILVGGADLAKALGTELTDPMIDVRQQIVHGAAAAGIPAVDALYFGPRDGLVAALEESRALGFSGKSLLSPSQVAPCHDTFSA